MTHSLTTLARGLPIPFVKYYGGLTNAYNESQAAIYQKTLTLA
jgi:hypothetical protein